MVLRSARGMRRATKVDTVGAGFAGVCDGTLPAGRIVDAIAQLLGEDAVVVRDRTPGSIRMLVEQGLPDPSPTPSPRSPAAGGVSAVPRRQPTPPAPPRGHTRRAQHGVPAPPAQPRHRPAPGHGQQEGRAGQQQRVVVEGPRRVGVHGRTPFGWRRRWGRQALAPQLNGQRGTVARPVKVGAYRYSDPAIAAASAPSGAAGRMI